MFDRALNTPLVSSLVIRFQGRFVKQNYWRGIGFRDSHWKGKSFFGPPGNKYFLHPLARKVEVFFSLVVDIISKLCSTSKSSKRSPVFNLEHDWMDCGFWKLFQQTGSNQPRPLRIFSLGTRLRKHHYKRIAKVIPRREFL